MTNQIRNPSRRALREIERYHQIVTRSDVPLRRSERQRLEMAIYWKKRFDERTAKAQAVIRRYSEGR